MKTKVKTVIAIAVALLLCAVLVFAIVSTAGGGLDVVANQSVTSFEAMLQALPEPVSASDTGRGWQLVAPDGEATFAWGEGFANGGMMSAAVSWQAQPFVDAGLDVTKLPSDYTYANGKLSLITSFASGTASDGQHTPVSDYRMLVSRSPAALNYHMSLDHFGILLGNGNLFEWARNLQTNTATNAPQDKDIVFVLNPEPLIAAGVTPEKVAGWAYAQVEVMQGNNTVQVYKFLKPYDLV